MALIAQKERIWELEIERNIEESWSVLPAFPRPK